MRYFRRLPLEMVQNARDLGGYPLLEGGATRRGAFLRSSALDDASQGDLDFLKDYGVTTVIDLRREREVKTFADKLVKIQDSFDYHHVSLAKGPMRDEEIEDILSGKITVGENYYGLIDNFKAVKEIFEIMARSEGVILYNCQEGKDRTGIISMILLGLAGVERRDIIADYEVSSANLGYIERYDEDEPFSVFRITSPYTMRLAYSYVIRKYGSFEDYLKYCKLDDETIGKVREKIIED